MTTGTATAETVARHVPANGTDIHFIEAGQGDPLILLHGGVVTTNPIWAGVPLAYTSYLNTLAEHFRGHPRRREDRPIRGLDLLRPTRRRRRGVDRRPGARPPADHRLQ